ncbi:patatin-like phospholipase family protein [Alteromonas sp. a30]|uniref:patatin-like phospholipase family protein n=1 Tax=Alteromonas sp. a30 TaxID=2730917 RepID=UPI0022826FE3|nr:patatin-like phospholipase family protein [Alteromonas sp. a30]
MNLAIYAGPSALSQLLDTGLVADDFDVMLGASGGPKWFTLYGLDKVLVPEFFKGRSKTLDLVGSSAGAFRFACLTQAQPLKALDVLAQEYAQTAYSSKRPSMDEVTESVTSLLDKMLGETGSEEISSNPVFKAHLIAVKCYGLLASERKASLSLGLAKSAAKNAISRQKLRTYFSRAVFSTPESDLQILDPSGFETQFVDLNANNVKDVLVASGSIPGIIHGVRNIEGADEGMYRDGGVLDYHFDLQFPNRKGLTLYPHFYPKPVPGWFDKFTKRRPHAASYDKVVMLAPSESYVAQLPFGKISDRNDYSKISKDERIAYWKTVLKEGDKLADDFKRLQDDVELLRKHIQPLPFATK